jgi:hypothetical protein
MENVNVFNLSQKINLMFVERTASSPSIILMEFVSSANSFRLIASPRRYVNAQMDMCKAPTSKIKDV